MFGGVLGRAAGADAGGVRVAAAAESCSGTPKLVPPRRYVPGRSKRIFAASAAGAKHADLGGRSLSQQARIRMERQVCIGVLDHMRNMSSILHVTS